ncbi:hypothetical protein J437_LFUL001085 [Ladona fulva]|uniref:FAS1 domain-containing protein n=1 Tax=Ladona fulva TaxID=123851 RepID=A0A8K0K131_LADFU|nr:hypothetical protein J437_LFUL001085 [Ladona fulva]
MKVLYTDNNNSTIRINVYASTTINEKDARGKMHHALMGGKIVTANCACIGNKEEPANSEEMGKRSIGSRRATNGVAHMVDRVLTPVQRTLAEHIASHPRLSKFRALLAAHGGKNGPAESLLKALESEKETLTLFAPTDKAFDKLTEEQNEDLFKGKSCTPSILEHHVVGRTLCSAAIPQIQDYIALATTRQGENLRLEWLEGEAGQWVLTIKGSNEQSDKITVTDIDIVATNGVMHLVDSILFPVSARQINQALQDSNLTVFASYLENADMMHDMENFTLFAPTNEAMMKWLKDEDMDEDASALSEEVQDRVKDILKFHLATPMDMFGFGWDKATVQCANILSADKSSCNNVIHVIDRVLIPPSGNIFETISSNPSYSILTKILKGTKLEKELTESNGVNGYTLLAPDDDALGRLEKDQLDGLLEDKKVAERILSTHVIPGVMCCSSVKNPTPWPFTRQQLVNTLAWDVILAVHRDHKGHIHFDREPVGRGTKVTKCDMAATNGIIHTVNRLIIS